MSSSIKNGGVSEEEKHVQLKTRDLNVPCGQLGIDVLAAVFNAACDGDAKFGTKALR